MIQLEYRDGQWYEVAGDTQKPVDIDTVVKRVEEPNVMMGRNESKSSIADKIL